VKVYQVLLIYQYLSLSGYQVLLQQSQEAYKVLKFSEMFLTHPTKKLKNLNPTQPNPWVDPTHGQLWYTITAGRLYKVKLLNFTIVCIEVLFE